LRLKITDLKFSFLLASLFFTAACGGVGGYAKPGMGLYKAFSDEKVTDDEKGQLWLPEIALDTHIGIDPNWGVMTGFAAWGGLISQRIGPAFYLNNAHILLVPYLSTPLGNHSPIPFAATASAIVFPGQKTGWRWGLGAEYSLGLRSVDDDPRRWRLGFNFVFGYQDRAFHL